jgi:hypothetical protein
MSGLLTRSGAWCALVYRTNTYPFLHVNAFHLVVNLLALTPMLERFESEHGTLTSLALFLGRESLAILRSDEGKCELTYGRLHSAVDVAGFPLRRDREVGAGVEHASDGG